MASAKTAPQRISAFGRVVAAGGQHRAPVVPSATPAARTANATGGEASPFAHLRGARLPALALAAGSAPVSGRTSASTAEAILAASRARRGEIAAPPIARPDTAANRAAAATAAAIVDAGKRRRGETK